MNRARAVLAVVALICATLATTTQTVGAQANPPEPLDLETLNPVALNTWGVVGIGNTYSKQRVQVWDFAEIGDRLYVAGSFTDVQENETAAPIAQPYLAAFDLDTGDYIPTFTPSFDRTIYDLEVHNGRLLVGGEFTMVNGVAREGLVALDPITGAIDATMPFWADRPFNATQPGVVRTLFVEGDTLYMGGNFNYINNGTGGARSRAYSVGRVDLGNNKLDAAWAPRTTGSGIWDLTVDPVRNHVSFVGFFTAVNAEPDTDLMATVSGVDGQLVPGLASFEPTAPQQTTTIAIVYSDDKLFIGGSEHVVQILDANTNVRVAYTTAGIGCTSTQPNDCSPRYTAGGDFQTLEIIDGYVLGGCHCFGPRNRYIDTHQDLIHYNSIDDKWDGDRFVIPTDPVDGGDASDWRPDLAGNAKFGTWAIFADSNGCLYLGGDYDTKGPLGSGAWLGGFGKFCPAGPSPVIDTSFSASRKAILGWSEPQMSLPVVNYRVYRDGVFIGTSPDLSYTDTNLVPDDVHNYTVEAVDSDNNRSPISDPVTVTVLDTDTVAPAAPTDLTGVAVDNTTTSLSWTAAVDDQAVKSYLIYRDFVFLQTVEAAGLLEFIDTGLTPGDTYRYEVRASDYGGNISDPSTPVNITTTGGPEPDTTPPSVPTGLAADTVGDNDVTISWTASTDDDSGLKSYLVYRDYTYVGLTLAADGLTFADSGLIAGETYRYHVRAKDFAGNTSASSSPIFVTTTGGPEPDTTAPTVPGDPSILSMTSNSVTLTWGASTDENSGMKSYLLYRDYLYIGRVLSDEPLEYTDTGLTTGQTYRYHVRAKDVSGNVSGSSLPVFATPEAP